MCHRGADRRRARHRQRRVAPPPSYTAAWAQWQRPKGWFYRYWPPCGRWLCCQLRLSTSNVGQALIRFGEVQRYRMSGDRSSLPAPSVRSRVLIQDPPPTCPDEQAGHVRVRVDQQRSRGSGYASQPMAVGSTAGRLAVLTRSLPGAGGDTMLATLGDWTGHPLFGSAGRCPRRDGRRARAGYVGRCRRPGPDKRGAGRAPRRGRRPRAGPGRVLARRRACARSRCLRRKEGVRIRRTAVRISSGQHFSRPSHPAPGVHFCRPAVPPASRGSRDPPVCSRSRDV